MGKTCSNSVAAVASTSSEIKMNEKMAKNMTNKELNENGPSKCNRTSSNNSSFTAGSTGSKRKISRFNDLNRSFNRTTNTASDFRRKIDSEKIQVNEFSNSNGNVSTTETKNLLASKSPKNSTSDLNVEGNSSGRSIEDFLIATKADLLSTDLMRKFSQKVKNQVQSSLSEPLRQQQQNTNHTGKCEDYNSDRCLLHQKQDGAQELRAKQDRLYQGIMNGERDNEKNSQKYLGSVESSPLARTKSVRTRVAMISNRLQLPKFLTDNNNDNEGLQRHDDGEFVAASSSDESDDPELTELREREQIVEKYEKGPDSKDVDPWENPDFELYKVTDRYGFVHNKELTAEESESRRVERELKRESKWLRMLDEWKRRHPEKLPSRIWKGIPDKLRLVYWKRMLNVEEMKVSARPNLYNELLMRARLVSKEIKQIDLDINRTYRDHLAFRRRYDVKQQSLFNVLAAYAMFNTEVGYCQGMSQIAAIFLMYMDEEDAFWCMHSLLTNRKYAMHGFFVPGFPKLARFQHHYEKVIQKYLPKLQKHLDKAGIPNIHLTKWWFGCFLDRVPFSLAIRVWDVFLYFGDSILIAMAYNIMKMHKKTFIKLQMEGFMEFIQQRLAADFGYPNDQVMESLEDCLKKLQSDRMALPPPPNPNDPPELPTRPLGPILTRSMVDIRMDIAEIHSRSSRSNSVAGRSPALKRYHQKHYPAASSVATDPSTRRTPQPTTDSGAASAVATPIPTTTTNNEAEGGTPITTLPADAFAKRIPSTKRQNGLRPLRPPPVPDADGFVPMSPRNQPASNSNNSIKDGIANTTIITSGGGKERVLSCYDNVTTSGKRNSLKNRKVQELNSAPPDPNARSGAAMTEVPVTRAQSTRITQPIAINTVASATTRERNIGTGSLRHKTEGRNLTKVIQMYQEQHKQLQQHLQQLPRDEDSIKENRSNMNNSSSKRTSLTISTVEGTMDPIVEAAKKEEALSRIVHRTPDNVTYVSVMNSIEHTESEKTIEPELRHQISQEFSKQEDHRIQKKSATNEPEPRSIRQSQRHTSAVPIPYCPPPDYNEDYEDERHMIMNSRSQSSFTTRQNQPLPIIRSRNADPATGYGGSLYRSYQTPSSDPRQFVHQKYHHGYAGSYGYVEDTQTVPDEQLLYHRTQHSGDHCGPSVQNPRSNRQPVSATFSQPLNAHSTYYGNVPSRQRTSDAATASIYDYKSPPFRNAIDERYDNRHNAPWSDVRVMQPQYPLLAHRMEYDCSPQSYYGNESGAENDPNGSPVIVRRF